MQSSELSEYTAMSTE